MREVPTPTRGSGPIRCCGGHRDRCAFGRPHIWATWYENAELQRTSDTVHCHVCNGVCTAEEEAVAAGMSDPRIDVTDRAAVPHKPTATGNTCATCGTTLTPEDTIAYSHDTGLTRCIGCEGLPAAGEEG